MSNDINLLPNKQKTVKSHRLQVQLMRFSSIGFLFVVSVSAMILFFLIAFSPLPQFQEREQFELAIIQQHHQKLSKLLFIHDRIADAQGVMSKRLPVDVTIESVRQILPASAEIQSLTAEGKKMKVRVISSSLLDLDTYLDNLRKLQADKTTVGKLKLIGITLDEDINKYAMTVAITLL